MHQTARHGVREKYSSGQSQSPPYEYFKECVTVDQDATGSDLKMVVGRVGRFHNGDFFLWWKYLFI